MMMAFSRNVRRTQQNGFINYILMEHNNKKNNYQFYGQEIDIIIYYISNIALNEEYHRVDHFHDMEVCATGV